MGAMSVRLPDSIHRRLKALATRERVSMNQLVTTALAEKLSALDTEDYLKSRAERASDKRFRQALRKVPDAQPLPGDEL